MAKSFKFSASTIDLIIKVLIDVCYILVKHYVNQKLSKNQVKTISGVFRARVFRYLTGACARIDKLPEECDCISEGVYNTKGVNTDTIRDPKWLRKNGICAGQEHMTPVKYLADFCFDCIYNKVNQPLNVIESELRNILNKMYKVCWVTKSEMAQLDSAVAANGKKLKNYMPNTQDPYSRYTTAGVKFFKIDIAKTWHSPNPNKKIFLLP